MFLQFSIVLSEKAFETNAVEDFFEALVRDCNAQLGNGRRVSKPSYTLDKTTGELEFYTGSDHWETPYFGDITSCETLPKNLVSHIASDECLSESLPKFPQSIGWVNAGTYGVVSGADLDNEEFSADLISPG